MLGNSNLEPYRGRDSEQHGSKIDNTTLLDVTNYHILGDLIGIYYLTALGIRRPKSRYYKGQSPSEGSRRASFFASLSQGILFFLLGSAQSAPESTSV